MTRVRLIKKWPHHAAIFLLLTVGDVYVQGQ